MKRSLTFLEFNIDSTYMPQFDPSDEHLYQITVPLSIEPESKSYDTCPWSEGFSDDFLYEVAAQLSNKRIRRQDGY